MVFPQRSEGQRGSHSRVIACSPCNSYNARRYVGYNAHILPFLPYPSVILCPISTIMSTSHPCKPLLPGLSHIMQENTGYYPLVLPLFGTARVIYKLFIRQSGIFRISLVSLLIHASKEN